MPGVVPSDGNSSVYYSKLINELEEEMEEQARKARQRLSEREADLEEAHARELGERERDSEESHRKIKADAVESVEKERAAARAELEQLRKQTYDRNGRTLYEAETSRQRELTLRQIEQAEQDYKRRAEVLDANVESRMRRAEERTEEALKNQAHRMSQSHDFQMRSLQEQVSDLIDVEKRYGKEKGQGASDAIREYENQWRNRERVTVDGFQDQIENLKRDKREQEAYLGRLKEETVNDKDRYFAGVISRQNSEHQNRLKESEASFSSNIDELKGRFQRERERHDSLQKYSAEQADKNLSSALENQSSAYQKTLKRQTASYRDEISGLTKELNERKTTADPSLISPAAESAVRKSVTAEYEKSFKAEQDRNRRDRDEIREEYVARLDRAVREAEAEKSALSRVHAGERSQERTNFLSHMHESEFIKDATLRAKDEELRRSSESTTERHATSLERQRQEYESMLSTQRDDAVARIQAIRQEAEFNAKMAHRAFATRQNEIIREYDRKLADQKRDYEALLDEVKGQTQQQLRDAERKHRQALDEQQRFYEQRMAQTEVQTKERERVISQNYEQDLEKLRRSNALLIQKKS